MIPLTKPRALLLLSPGKSYPYLKPPPSPQVYLSAIIPFDNCIETNIIETAKSSTSFWPLRLPWLLCLLAHTSLPSTLSSMASLSSHSCASQLKLTLPRQLFSRWWFGCCLGQCSPCGIHYCCYEGGPVGPTKARKQEGQVDTKPRPFNTSDSRSSILKCTCIILSHPSRLFSHVIFMSLPFWPTIMSGWLTATYICYVRLRVCYD